MLLTITVSTIPLAVLSAYLIHLIKLFVVFVCQETVTVKEGRPDAASTRRDHVVGLLATAGSHVAGHLAAVSPVVGSTVPVLQQHVGLPHYVAGLTHHHVLSVSSFNKDQVCCFISFCVRFYFV